MMAETLDPLSPSVNSPRMPGIMNKLRLRFGRGAPSRTSAGEGKL